MITHFKCTSCGHCFSLLNFSISTTCSKCGSLALIDSDDDLVNGLDNEVYNEQCRGQND